MMAGPVMKNLLLSVIDSPFGLSGFFRACENSTSISARGCRYVLFQRVEGDIGKMLTQLLLICCVRSYEVYRSKVTLLAGLVE